MPVMSSRNRLIYFRVSEDELMRFRALAEMKGSRSLSDLMRDALERLDGAQHQTSAEAPRLLAEINSLQQSISEMNLRLDGLTKQLDGVRSQTPQEKAQ